MGYRETAHRALQICRQVFRYARRTGSAVHNPASDLRGELLPVNHGHMATITEPKKIGELLRAIDTYSGTPAVKCALSLAPLVFLRPGELRHAEWAEIDFDNAEWRIPGPKMKMKDAHIVPLANQAIQIFKSIEPLTGHGRYVFPNARTDSRPISDNAILSALRRLDFSKNEICGHGFRAMASTILHGQGWKSEYIERQLAHEERNHVKAAYNHAQYLPERREMMQAWADYLDTLKRSIDKEGTA
jgi:integrase